MQRSMGSDRPGHYKSLACRLLVGILQEERRDNNKITLSRGNGNEQTLGHIAILFRKLHDQVHERQATSTTTRSRAEESVANRLGASTTRRWMEVVIWHLTTHFAIPSIIQWLQQNFDSPPVSSQPVIHPDLAHCLQPMMTLRYPGKTSECPVNGPIRGRRRL